MHPLPIKFSLQSGGLSGRCQLVAGTILGQINPPAHRLFEILAKSVSQRDRHKNLTPFRGFYSLREQMRLILLNVG